MKNITFLRKIKDLNSKFCKENFLEFRKRKIYPISFQYECFFDKNLQELQKKYINHKLIDHDVKYCTENAKFIIFSLIKMMQKQGHNGYVFVSQDVLKKTLHQNSTTGFYNSLKELEDLDIIRRIYDGKGIDEKSRLTIHQLTIAINPRYFSTDKNEMKFNKNIIGLMPDVCSDQDLKVSDMLLCRAIYENADTTGVCIIDDVDYFLKKKHNLCFSKYKLKKSFERLGEKNYISVDIIDNKTIFTINSKYVKKIDTHVLPPLEQDFKKIKSYYISPPKQSKTVQEFMIFVCEIFRMRKLPKFTLPAIVRIIDFFNGDMDKVKEYISSKIKNAGKIKHLAYFLISLSAVSKMREFSHTRENAGSLHTRATLFDYDKAVKKVCEYSGLRQEVVNSKFQTLVKNACRYCYASQFEALLAKSFYDPSKIKSKEAILCKALSSNLKTYIDAGMLDALANSNTCISAEKERRKVLRPENKILNSKPQKCVEASTRVQKNETKNVANLISNLTLKMCEKTQLFNGENLTQPLKNANQYAISNETAFDRMMRKMQAEQKSIKEFWE